MANTYWTVGDIANALRVTPGRVRQIIGTDKTFPRPRGAFRATRGRTWDECDVRDWAATSGRRLHTDHDEAGSDRWTPGTQRPTYQGYRLVLGHDVLTYTGASQRVALAQRRTSGPPGPTPDRLAVDAVVTWGPFDLSGNLVTADGAVGKVSRRNVAAWLGDTTSPGVIPWWEPKAVTPTMLAMWRPGDPPFPATDGPAVDDPVWRLLGDPDPLVVAFARCRIAGHYRGLADGVAVLPQGTDPLHVVGGVTATVEATENDCARQGRGAMNLLSRRDEVAMHPDVALMAAEEVLSWASHRVDDLGADTVKRIVDQWEPATATGAHVALCTNSSDSHDDVQFFVDPFNGTPRVVTPTRLVVAAPTRGTATPTVAISTVRHDGRGETAVVTDTDGRLHLPHRPVTYGYLGTGPANFARWLAEITQGTASHAPRAEATMLAQHLSTVSGDQPLDLTGEEVTRLLGQDRTDTPG